MANNPAHVVTGICRLSYVALTQPRAGKNNQEPKFSVTLLLPKNDVSTKQKIDAAIEAAAQDGAQRLWGGVRPPIVPVAIYDGDGTRPSDGMPYSPECKGHWIIKASTKNKPEVVDQALNPILQTTEIYSGMYGRTGITFLPYLQEGKKGVTCKLDNVQKLADGEPLGSHVSAQEDFSAPAAGIPAQGMPTAPAQLYPQTYQSPAQAPAYPQPAPQSFGYQQPPQQPAYAPQAYPAAPGYPQPAIDPITGQPVAGAPAAGIYGL